MAYGDFKRWSIATGADDWDDNSSTGTTISAISNTLTVPHTSVKAYMRFKSSKKIFDIHPRAVIESMELNWYVQGTTISRRHPGPSVDIDIYAPWATDAASGYIEIKAYNPISLGTGWQKYTIQENAKRYIARTLNNNGGYTQFRWEVDAVRAHNCTHKIRAYEYGIGHLSAGYLDIYYHIPQEKKRRIRRIWSKG